jgi:hypothetical protein
LGLDLGSRCGGSGGGGRAHVEFANQYVDNNVQHRTGAGSVTVTCAASAGVCVSMILGLVVQYKVLDSHMRRRAFPQPLSRIFSC